MAAVDHAVQVDVDLELPLLERDLRELAHHRVFQVTNYAKEGQEVEVKILSIDPQAQKMSLSLKATLAPPPGKESGKPKTEEQDETVREAIIPKRQAPLKGGTKGQKGGEKFGLNW